MIRLPYPVDSLSATPSPRREVGRAHRFAFLLAALALLLVSDMLICGRAVGQGGATVTVVSAASFEPGPVAPEAIVSAFGSALATRTEVAPGLPLPTELSGRTVTVNGQTAQLFFVSPDQINFLIPANTAPGAASVVVRAGNAVVSSGTVQIARVAPSLFTANASGQGVAAAVALRVKPDGSQTTEAVMRFDQAQNRFVTAPIDLGPEGEQVFLILFGTGIRGRSEPSSVIAKIGGVDAEAPFAGPQGVFAGLDQINLRLPRALAGRGRVNVALSVANAGASNLCEVEIGAPASQTPPQVTGFNPPMALAGQTMTVNGAGFSSSAAENLVRVGGVEAKVMAASATQLTIVVPFGGRRGPVSVRTPNGEGASSNHLLVRTSISGVIEDTNRQPLRDVTVRLIGAGITARTGAEGSFILPDAPSSPSADLEIDGGTVSSLPYPKLRLKLRVTPEQDNQLPRPIALQQVSGPSLSAGSSALAKSARSPSRSSSPAQAISGRIQTGDVVFEVPSGAAVSFPEGTTGNALTLSIVENSRTPVNLPASQFSAVIPQVAPFGATLLPGGKLTFPNREGYPAGRQVKLFRLDQTRNSPTLGSFVEVGAAVVSADGQRIETAANAITEVSIYFVSNAQPTTTVVGRVVDSDGTTPVRQALVRCRGQEAFTDGNGGFILREVGVGAGDEVVVEASFVRPGGRVDRAESRRIPVSVGGVTTVTPDLVLTSAVSNRPPVILAPTSLTVNVGETRDTNIVVCDPDGDQPIQVTVSGANFARIIPRDNCVYTLRLQPLTSDGGRSTLTITATDNQTESNRHDIRLTVNRPPVANAQSALTDEDMPRAITLRANDPDDDPLSYVIVSNPSRGALSGTPPNLTYTPQPNYNGDDSFRFRVSDGFADSNVATVSVLINPVNDRPVLTVPGSQVGQTGQNLSFTVAAMDVDTDQRLTITDTGRPGEATFTQTSATSARFSWTPLPTQTGNYTVTFMVRDDGAPALSDTKTVAIRVVGRWEPAASLDSGFIRDLAVVGTTLFAGGEGGVFRSNDQGQNWTPANGGLPELQNSRFFPLFANGAMLFAGGFNSVFRSTDLGQSWTKFTRGLPGREVTSFAALGPNLFAGTGGGGVFRSTDQGESWTAATTGLPQKYVWEFATNGAALFAALGDDGGVFVSTDNGQNWRPANTGLPVATAYSIVASGSILIVSTTRGVFRSTDNGQSWLPANNGIPSNAIAGRLGLSGSNLFMGIFTGVCVSTNLGQSWSFISAGFPKNVIDGFAVSGANIFASTRGTGVFLSTNQGQSWASVNKGLTLQSAFGMAVSGTNLFVATDGGVYVSANNGQSWRLSNEGLPYTVVRAFAVSGNTVFVGGLDIGVFSSTDQGQSWVERNVGLTNRYVGSLAVSGATLLAGTGACGPFECFQPGGVFVSDNLGQSWRSAGLNNLGISAVAISGTDFFAAAYGAGVFRATNRGQNWTPINVGLTNLNVNALIVAGANLFVGTNGGGIFRSTDNGNNWTPVNEGLTNLFTDRLVYALAVNDTDLIAGTYDGVFISRNNGQSWAPVREGLMNRIVRSLAVSDGKLFAGTFGGGVFVSQ